LSPTQPWVTRLVSAFSLSRNLTVKASISVAPTYYIRVSDTVVVSAFISTETETSSNCRRCLAMDVRVDSYNQPLSGTPQYVRIRTFIFVLHDTICYHNHNDNNPPFKKCR
jgi:hypothetical protein